jgi:para-nitrobenzyl esterase
LTSDSGARDPLEVRVTGGIVRGRSDGRTRSWLGVPYARAPVGPLRFRAPQPAERWDGVRAATRFGRVAPQAFRGQFFGAAPGIPTGEDCLTINVMAPEGKGPAERLPVMVWIHAGGYSVGSSRTFSGRGGAFVRSGRVVFVSFNYRVGAFGYLDFSRYGTAERPIDGNLGPRDQLAALRWVRDNIAAFGGDPDDVTVFGESAGANAVVALLAMPAATGLFARAIAQSPPSSAYYSPELAGRWAEEFVEILRRERGRTGSASALELLTTARARELVAAATTLQVRSPAAYPGTFPLAPVIDGDLLPEAPLDAIRAGRGQPVPLIVGSMRREGALFRGRLDILPRSADRMQAVFDRAPVDARGPMREVYPGLPARRAALDFAGDYGFWFPSVRTADLQSDNAPVHAYRFDAAPRLLRLAGLDATHALEIPVLFAPGRRPFIAAMSLLGGGAAFLAAGARMRGHWLDFATTGRVTDAWPAYTREDRSTLIFGAEDRIESDPRGADRAVWERFLPQR